MSTRASQSFLNIIKPIPDYEKSINNAIKFLILSSLNSLNLFTVLIKLGNLYIQALPKLTESEVTEALLLYEIMRPTGAATCSSYEVSILGKIGM